MCRWHHILLLDFVHDKLLITCTHVLITCTQWSMYAVSQTKWERVNTRFPTLTIFIDIYWYFYFPLCSLKTYCTVTGTHSFWNGLSGRARHEYHSLMLNVEYVNSHLTSAWIRWIREALSKNRRLLWHFCICWLHLSTPKYTEAWKVTRI